MNSLAFLASWREKPELWLACAIPYPGISEISELRSSSPRHTLRVLELGGEDRGASCAEIADEAEGGPEEQADEQEKGGQS